MTTSLVPVPGTTYRVPCSGCGKGYLRATYGSFQSDMICNLECGHRANMCDIEPAMNERLAFDSQGFLTVTEYVHEDELD